MAAYAALLSLMHTIEQIQNHPNPPISLDKTYIQLLTEKLTFLREFLENYADLRGARKDFEGLEGCMADAAYEAEDIIESHIVHQLQPPNHEENFGLHKKFFRGSCKATSHEENIGPIGLYEGLEKVMQDLDLIKGDLEEIMKNEGIQPERSYSMPVGQQRLPPAPNGLTVGLDESLLAAMDKLIGQQSSREIIPIVGMGGIGKTTLARNLYEHPTIEQHFDLRGWATVSQQYDSKGILVEVIASLTKIDSKKSMTQLEEHELGQILRKTLFDRKYLIVMDDIWSIQAWDKVKFYFPDNNNGSRILITTRLSNLALELSGDSGIEMGFLDEDKSWDLLQKNVFREQDCPMELNKIGKQIARNCKGLPLSIVVIGGLLAKSNQTQKHWQSIEENLNSLVNLNDNERCLRILRMSYNNLPVHLKPCFLYMGIFPEDHLVRASTLVNLWVAEGFLKPISNKTMEATAEEYLKDLVQRNLVLVGELRYDGNIKICRIHDLLRDLCIKEAENRFFRVAAIDRPNTRQSNTRQSWDTQRRIGIHRRESSRKHASRKVRNNVRSAELTRSLLCNVDKVIPSQHSYRLLRVFHRIELFISDYNYSLKDIFRSVNSRHIVLPAEWPRAGQFPSSFYHLWNLQTLRVTLDYSDFNPTAPLIDIWRMPRLRHVKIFYFCIPDPPTGEDDSNILRDLQTLMTVSTSRWCNQINKRIPNIKKLNIIIPYNESSSIDDYELDNLGGLQELETLYCNFSCTDDSIPLLEHELARNLEFPNSIRKLSLATTYLRWEDLAAKVGHLPHLQELNLKFSPCKGTNWETVEGQFPNLKVLKIHSWRDLEDWIMEDCAHFPLLEHLVFEDMPNLKAIPKEIGEVTTMKSIRLINCKESVAISAKEIGKLQEEYGNQDFRVSVELYQKNQTVESLASPRFQIEISSLF